MMVTCSTSTNREAAANAAVSNATNTSETPIAESDAFKEAPGSLAPKPCMPLSMPRRYHFRSISASARDLDRVYRTLVRCGKRHGEGPGGLRNPVANSHLFQGRIDRKIASRIKAFRRHYPPLV